MAIRCPYCMFEMELKGARPGRFIPRCAACGEKFSLLIPENQKVSPTVGKAVDEVYESLVTLKTPEPAPSAPATAEPPTQTATAETSAPPPPVSQEPAADQNVMVTIVQPPPVDASAAPATVATTAAASPIAIVPALPSAPPTLQAPDAPAAPPPPQANAPSTLTGYEIIQQLGRGGTGAVYLARQVSTNTIVTVKVIDPPMADHPQVIAALTRTAYAAAHLDHPNLVKLLEFGVDGDHHFFATEFIDGGTLADKVREHGKLDPEAAVSYVLQAARGIKFAHDRGLLHRNIKPDNLLLNDQGMVKVADLGLAAPAFPNSSTHPPGEIRTNISESSAGFMAPEIARNGAHVDQRSDIYALGCTLYDLVTGRPPFMGRSAMEVITKHHREPVVPPDMVVRSVPRLLSAIILKMVAKIPEQRFRSMDEVITALEDFLNLSTVVTLSAKSEHAHALEGAAKKFNSSAWVVLRWQIIIAFFTACAGGFAALLLTGHPEFAKTVLGIAVLTPLAYQIILGVTQQAFLAIKTRQFFLGSGILDWMILIIFAGLVGTFLFVFGLLIPWAGAAVLAAIFASGFHFTVDYLRDSSRKMPIDQVETMLRHLRLRGLDEMALRQFVRRFSGRDNDDFYEAIFGYEAMLQARHLWSGGKHRRRRSISAWRDRVIRWIDRRINARRSARYRKLLRQLETDALLASGASKRAAWLQARQSVSRLMSSVSRVGAAPKGSPTAPVPQASHDVLTNLAAHRAGVDVAEPLEELEFEREHQSWLRRRFGTPVDLIFGARLRFMLAILILFGFALWWHQNNTGDALNRAAQVISTRRELDISNQDMTKVSGQIRVISDQLNNGADVAMRKTGSQPLQLPFVPPLVAIALSSWNAAVAGGLLLLSIFCTGRLMAFTVLLAAAVALVGHWFNLPNFGYPAAWMSASAAGIIGMIGLFFFRRQEV